jgi:hypothetical protein
MRIVELRTRYAAARSQDGRGVSLGPTAVRCPEVDGVIQATFVNVEPPLANLAGDDRSLVLAIAPRVLARESLACAARACERVDGCSRRSCSRARRPSRTLCRTFASRDRPGIWTRCS